MDAPFRVDIGRVKQRFPGLKVVGLTELMGKIEAIVEL